MFLRIIKQDAEENKSEPNRIEYRTLNEDIWPDTDKGGNENFKNTLCKSGNAEQSHRGRKDCEKSGRLKMKISSGSAAMNGGISWDTARGRYPYQWLWLMLANTFFE